MRLTRHLVAAIVWVAGCSSPSASRPVAQPPPAAVPEQAVELTGCLKPGSFGKVTDGDGEKLFAEAYVVAGSADMIVLQSYDTLRALGLDGVELWSWKARPATGPQSAGVPTVWPAPFLHVGSREVTAAIADRVVILDATSGKPRYLSAVHAWEPDTLWGVHDRRLAWADAKRVYAMAPGEDLDSALLLECADYSRGFIVQRDGGVLGVDRGFQWKKVEREPSIDGAVLAWFVDANNNLRAVTVSDEHVSDGRQCYDLEALETGGRQQRATSALVTRAGILFHTKEEDRAHTGRIALYPFPTERDFRPCRRLTFRPVLPDGAGRTDSGEAPAENLQDAHPTSD